MLCSVVANGNPLRKQKSAFKLVWSEQFSAETNVMKQNIHMS